MRERGREREEREREIHTHTHTHTRTDRQERSFGLTNAAGRAGRQCPKNSRARRKRGMIEAC